jgi:hypothetical protein
VLRALTRWEWLVLAAAVIAALFYLVQRLWEKLSPHDSPPDGPVDNNLS